MGLVLMQNASIKAKLAKILVGRATTLVCATPVHLELYTSLFAYGPWFVHTSVEYPGKTARMPNLTRMSATYHANVLSLF